MTLDFDAIIVGYGPVGQTLALMLGKAGMRVGIVERYSSLFGMPRAVHFDHEVGRIFQSAGIADEVRAISEPQSQGVFKYMNADRQVLMEITLGGDGPSGWPYTNGFAQQQLEATIDAAVRTQPDVTVHRGWECIALQQDADRVTVSLRNTAGDMTNTLTAGYVIGADGANSFVRQQMKTTVTDLGFAWDWLVVSVVFKSESAARADVVQICDPKRSITVCPGGPNRQRLEFMLAPGETAEQMNQEAVVWELISEFGLTPENVDIERHAVYTFNARWADDWRDGRLLLAGDAAHVMPPFRAQGLCSGIRDVAALAWRFALIHSGVAKDTLLDSYGPERKAHVIEWIRQAVEIGNIICIPDPAAAAKRDAFMLAASRDPTIAPPRPAPPKLGAVLAKDGDEHAGKLDYQGVVTINGMTGLFDDLAGRGFTLVGTAFDPAAALSDENRRWFAAIGGVVAYVSPEGEVHDAGGYRAFQDTLGVGAVLSRPDFHIFGTATSADEIDALVDALRIKLDLKAEELARLAAP